ncbi:MAG: ATP-binding cassette domain-containing protein [Bacteroidaceae bacterium]|jgi:cell division transport system ATP-binding protein|nr:ATP-binding cassette domain-containing protein [Bacteroidaceae bacterium]
MALVVDYKNVKINQADKTILQDVNFQVEEGSLIYLTGRVGTGKSTLLKTMYGELPIVEGEALMLGTYQMDKKMKDSKLQELRRKIGIVFQDFQLLGDRTVEKNLDFVLKATDWKNKQEISNRITEVLKLVGLEDKRDKYPNQLSGGEQQRVCIARAILNNPKLVLADEPTGNLDIVTSKNILELLHKISENGSTVIISTHNLSLISSFPGTVFEIKDTHIEDITEEFNRPIDMVEISELETK